MSRDMIKWLLNDNCRPSMLLVYEITIDECGSVGIKVIARYLHTLLYEKPGQASNNSSRKFLVSLNISRRRQNYVKRLGGNNRIDPGDFVAKILRLKKNNVPPQSFPNTGNTSPSLAVVPVALSVVTTGHSLVNNLEQTSNEEPNVSRSLPNLESPAAILPDQISCNEVNTNSTSVELSADANATQTGAWLRASRFQAFETTFSNFSAADILRLSRDDLIQICGLANGIRLFNALHSKTPTPKLTLYFAIESGNGVSLWRVIYLDNLSSGALASKLLATFNLPNDRLHSILLQGPQGIQVLVSNDVVANMKDESMFLVETIKDSSSERYKLLLKPSSR